MYKADWHNVHLRLGTNFKREKKLKEKRKEIKKYNNQHKKKGSASSFPLEIFTRDPEL